jgi:hypothetical protein
MPPSIVHHPRVAWDCARLLVTMAETGDELFGWFSGQVGQLLGDAYQRDLGLTRARLRRRARPDVAHVEAGLWRMRFEDLLLTDPELAEDLRILRLQALTRLG